jgi:Tol biopolymer transport system component
LILLSGAASALGCSDRVTDPASLVPSFLIVPSTPRRSDWIVFSSTRAIVPPLGSQIWKMRPDGSLLQQLTTGELDGEPVFSPDLSRIAYTGLVGVLGTFEIFVMNADGSGQTQLTSLTPWDDPGSELHPTWSPDGTQIAFVATRDGTTRSTS